MSDDEHLVQRFEACSLPFREWTHEAHVRVTFQYLKHLTPQEAVERMRQGIQRYNTSHGRSESYHETITVAMVYLIWERMAALSGPYSSEDLRARNPEIFVWNPTPLCAYYSKARLDSDRARRVYLEPDLRPFAQEWRTDVRSQTGDASVKEPKGRYRTRVLLETASGSVFRQFDAETVVERLREIDGTLDVTAAGDKDHVLIIRANQLNRLRHLVSYSPSFPQGLRVIQAEPAARLEIYPQEKAPGWARKVPRRR